MSSASDPEIRRADSSDVPAILETLKAALGETPILRRTRRLWEWKHVMNPFGASLVLVAEASGRIAGVRALMQWQLVQPDGTLVRCMRAVDTATHPDFARQGIFRRLTMRAVDEARELGIELIFNTPNDMSAPGYLKMGWSEVARIGVLARPRLGEAASVPDGSVPTVASLGPSLTKALPRAGIPDREPLGLRTPRSPEYLAWRFTRHPTAQYGWLGSLDHGWLVARASTRKSRSELVLSDLLGSPKPALVRRLAREHRARYMAGWFSPGSPERGIAIRGGMLPVPGLRALRLVALPLADIGLDVSNLGSWDLATSDLELL
ncbi:MAG: GNAT family N-acetyltransferase [Acidimicrobiia bacterium]|nr:GNAT family N-acetyltransferase [Acidimicrobiia bacterium]